MKSPAEPVEKPARNKTGNPHNINRRSHTHRPENPHGAAKKLPRSAQGRRGSHYGCKFFQDADDETVESAADAAVESAVDAAVEAAVDSAVEAAAESAAAAADDVSVEESVDLKSSCVL